ncbi:TPA: DUF551 domain-containing protein [Klebsiella pneumoniae]|nr:DUF551 domain-containing protein [Klebsiella pneumoniae]
MTKSTITRERIELIANFHRAMALPPSHDEIEELARMALSAMDSESNRNPVLAYADSYRDMAKQGVESVPIWSVITDLERNIAPLYRHAQPVPVVPEEACSDDCPELYPSQPDAWAAGWNACRAAMLAASPQDTPALNSVQSVATMPGKWIPASERVPENDGAYLCWDKRYVTTYAFIFGAWQANQFIAKNITHWMPLPAAPQEVKGE